MKNSDHMVICSVDVGEDAPIQIVTGAPNVHEGDLVPVAKVGAILPGGIKIKKGQAPRRGVRRHVLLRPEIGVPDYLYPSVGDKGLLIFPRGLQTWYGCPPDSRRGRYHRRF